MAGAIVALLFIAVIIAILVALLLYKRERRWVEQYLSPDSHMTSCDLVSSPHCREVIVQIAMKAFGSKAAEPVRYRMVSVDVADTLVLTAEKRPSN